MSVRRVLLVGLVLCLGWGANAATKDVRFACRNLAGLTFGAGPKDRTGAPGPEGLINRVILIDLSDRKGFPVVRVRVRDPGQKLVDLRDMGATVHASYAGDDADRLLIVAKYQSRREEYLLTRDARGALLRLNRTRFLVGGWQTSVYAGHCTVTKA